jgi:hypothetical protein
MSSPMNVAMESQKHATALREIAESQQAVIRTLNEMVQQQYGIVRRLEGLGALAAEERARALVALLNDATQLAVRAEELELGAAEKAMEELGVALAHMPPREE